VTPKKQESVFGEPNAKDANIGSPERQAERNVDWIDNSASKRSEKSNGGVSDGLGVSKSIRKSSFEKIADEHSGRKKKASTLRTFTGDKDLIYMPESTQVLPWHLFNSDFWSNERSHLEVKDIAELHGERLVDLRPYMIEEPHVVFKTDKLPKVLDLFRHFHLRSLPVIDPNDGTPVAVLTRADIFSYMAL
jgi:CBS domain-containing protein